MLMGISRFFKKAKGALASKFAPVAVSALTVAGLAAPVAQAAEPGDPLVSAGTVLKPTAVGNLVFSIALPHSVTVDKSPSPYTEGNVSSIGNVFQLTSDKSNRYSEYYFPDSSPIIDSNNTNAYSSNIVKSGGSSYDLAAYASTGNAIQTFSASTYGLGQSVAYSGFEYYNNNNLEDPANGIVRTNQLVWKTEVPTVLDGGSLITGSVNFKGDLACAKGCTLGAATFLTYITEDGMSQGDLVNFRRNYSTQGSYSDSADFSFDLSPFAGQTLYFSLASGVYSAIYSTATLGSNNTISRDYNLIAASVPEPSVWASMLAGLVIVGGVAAARWRREPDEAANGETRFPAFGSGFAPSSAA